jgi:hypothetical protein
VPLSRPVVERLIGTIRRECLDRTLFWTAAGLEIKLLDFQGLLQSRASARQPGAGISDPSDDCLAPIFHRPSDP